MSRKIALLFAAAAFAASGCGRLALTVPQPTLQSEAQAAAETAAADAQAAADRPAVAPIVGYILN